jgi:hypothetical protein
MVIARAPAHRFCVALFCKRHRYGAGVEFQRFQRLSHHERRRHRPGFQSLAHVQCRNITGCVSLLFTFVAIATVDKLGRKRLTLVGSAGLALSFFLSYPGFQNAANGVLIVAYIEVAMAFYSFSLATMTWVLLSELFTNRIRGAAMSVSVFALWLGHFTVSSLFRC